MQCKAAIQVFYNLQKTCRLLAAVEKKLVLELYCACADCCNTTKFFALCYCSCIVVVYLYCNCVDRFTPWQLFYKQITHFSLYMPLSIIAVQSATCVNFFITVSREQIERKHCCRKETARCCSCSFRFKVRRQHTSIRVAKLRKPGFRAPNIPAQGLKWGGMRRYGIPSSQSLSHGHTVYERRKERLGNVPFCIYLEV